MSRWNAFQTKCTQGHKWRKNSFKDPTQKGPTVLYGLQKGTLISIIENRWKNTDLSNRNKLTKCILCNERLLNFIKWKCLLFNMKHRTESFNLFQKYSTWSQRWYGNFKNKLGFAPIRWPYEYSIFTFQWAKLFLS